MLSSILCLFSLLLQRVKKNRWQCIIEICPTNESHSFFFFFFFGRKSHSFFQKHCICSFFQNIGVSWPTKALTLFFQTSKVRACFPRLLAIVKYNTIIAKKSHETKILILNIVLFSKTNKHNFRLRTNLLKKYYN